MNKTMNTNDDEAARQRQWQDILNRDLIAAQLRSGRTAEVETTVRDTMALLSEVPLRYHLRYFIELCIEHNHSDLIPFFL